MIQNKCSLLVQVKSTLTGIYVCHGSKILCLGAGGAQEGEMPHNPYKEESDSEEEEEEIAAVEMILETYFMHCDNTYNKLQTLCEHPFPLPSF